MDFIVSITMLLCTDTVASLFSSWSPNSLWCEQCVLVPCPAGRQNLCHMTNVTIILFKDVVTVVMMFMLVPGCIKIAMTYQVLTLQLAGRVGSILFTSLTCLSALSYWVNWNQKTGQSLTVLDLSQVDFRVLRDLQQNVYCEKIPDVDHLKRILLDCKSGHNERVIDQLPERPTLVNHAQGKHVTFL